MVKGFRFAELSYTSELYIAFKNMCINKSYKGFPKGNEYMHIHNAFECECSKGIILNHCTQKKSQPNR
ncbi:hypothetical protein CSB09_01385 [Candidatus Gracilibacteria bacterium]|nr:MAG: hypothetical protein CSB09_01385 [Candidatus Gracilibacteria bacterium]